MSVKLMSSVFEAEIPDIEYTYNGETKVCKASTCKFVLLAIADHANDEGESSYPGLTRLETKTCLSRQGVLNAISALSHGGYLTVDPSSSKYGTNTYQVNVKQLVNPVDSIPSQPGRLVLVNPVDSIHHLTINDDKENIFKLWEQVIGQFPPPLVIEDLKAAQAEYPFDWLKDAFKIAVENNSRNWRYISTILKNWQEKGRDWQPTSKRNAPAALPSRPTPPPPEVPAGTKPPPEFYAMKERIHQAAKAEKENYYAVS